MHWATAIHINDFSVSGLCPRVICQIYSASTKQPPLLSGPTLAYTHSKCWELWWNRGCVLRSDCAKDAERKHSADCYASRVIWFSKGSLMVGFSCMLQILKRQHKQCRSHICTDQDPTLASNTRKTLSRLSKVAYSIWRWRGWNIVAAVWISTPPIACVYAVGAQHNNTTTVGWQTGTERWLKNDMLSHSCA